MLCSVLIASRHRPDGLHKNIQSLHATANPENFDVWIRLDDDDAETISRLPEFERYGNVHHLIGPRLNNYFSIGKFCSEIADLAAGEWVMITDDDALMLGSGWDEQLKAVPKTGYVAHPEFYWLDTSEYGSGSCGPVAAFVPNGCWKQYGFPDIGEPPDHWLNSLLVIAKGWKVWLLKGITHKHERGDEAALAEHHKR